MVGRPSGSPPAEKEETTIRKEKKKDKNKKFDWYSTIKKQKKVKHKKITLAVWICKNFPLQFKHLEPVINLLSNGSEMIYKLDEILKTDVIPPPSSVPLPFLPSFLPPFPPSFHFLFLLLSSFHFLSLTSSSLF